MKRKLPKESQEHEDVILDIANTIAEKGKDKVAFIILFGSFARGDWIYDLYKEGTTTYCYASDYDFLVVLKKNSQYSARIKDDFERSIKRHTHYLKEHKPSIIIEPIKRVNKFLERGHFFFSDIKKEGILLYDSGEFELSDAKELTKDEIIDIAQEHYDEWFESGADFIVVTKLAKEAKKFNQAAFLLHQSTERLLTCALLVLSDYKEKTHDIKELLRLCSSQDSIFLKIFPLGTEEEKKCFKLLRDAYVDARYNKYYKITDEQLEYLIEKVENLKIVVSDVCINHIENLKSK